MLINPAYNLGKKEMRFVPTVVLIGAVIRAGHGRRDWYRTGMDKRRRIKPRHVGHHDNLRGILTRSRRRSYRSHPYKTLGSRENDDFLILFFLNSLYFFLISVHWTDLYSSSIMAATTKGAAFFLRECLTGRCDNPDYGNKLKERLIYIFIWWRYRKTSLFCWPALYVLCIHV